MERARWSPLEQTGWPRYPRFSTAGSWVRPSPDREGALIADLATPLPLTEVESPSPAADQYLTGCCAATSAVNALNTMRQTDSLLASAKATRDRGDIRGALAKLSA